MKKLLYRNDYVALYDDGTVSMSDGVVPCGDLRAAEVEALYAAMHKYFAKKGYKRNENENGTETRV